MRENPLIVSVHSYRGGTGKSNITANLATIMAQSGLRVGVIDTDIQSPGINVLFGMNSTDAKRTLNDYLWGKCEIQDTAHDVTAGVDGTMSGRIFLVPSSMNPGDMARVLKSGYDVSLLKSGMESLLDTLELDALLIDTHPGLNEETLLSLALSDVLVILLRPDQQDYLGTSVTLKVADRLQVPQTYLLINKVPSCFAPEMVIAKVASSFGKPVLGLLQHSDDMMALASDGIFVTKYPNTAITATLRTAVEAILA
ncbi:MAG: CDP-3,6-dideoxy-D-glycero-L-glycero-4-hexulose-4-reductase [Desulfobulbaceae bacterium A2]|nr:MAG: CDP-3,6-dideoxy-D-glycero-L-glycero-4-hexulose-4-reductase [Desulfobulbaceae bacterium A2]